jgi:hypothetical protein
MSSCLKNSGDIEIRVESRDYCFRYSGEYCSAKIPNWNLDHEQTETAKSFSFSASEAKAECEHERA